MEVCICALPSLVMVVFWSADGSLRPELAAQIFKKTSKGSRFVLGFYYSWCSSVILLFFALVQRRFVNGKTKLFCGCKCIVSGYGRMRRCKRQMGIRSDRRLHEA
ncbi:hypothetical protein M431DRAFT_317086 [Trichoderma harzianum CBS 226.95]|uniref:Uncharacterized protein n=1 Tax=Trichoderma harzianum CBS 226.95 TaxID=983964 RepID=A0A2T3ZWA3_TRIHA|nr:hypothetical protein M431DRAFT_317086 [Trichoderma harzianum CBS 226.95]PTB49090.1 hypothetical protein M431DRAFT_317086 [Trichoderma harzianum CBS 226.95]